MTLDHRVRKRAFDITVSAVALMVTSPIMLASALLIRMESPGSPLFRQERVGCARKTFVLYKLRTMSVETEDLPSHSVSASQITRVGQILRRTKIDELPQLFNVIRGEMSLVGPRPCLPSQQDVLEARDSLGVYKERPGITGQAQLSGVDMSQPAKLAELDAAYLDDMRISTDVRILIGTALGRGGGDAAMLVPSVGEHGTPKAVASATVKERKLL